MNFVLMLAALLLPLPTSVHAQQLCSQCLSAATKELNTCMGSAISREDKGSCEEKHASKAAACHQGECILEQAAQSARKTQPPPEQGAIATEKPSPEEAQVRQ